MLRPNGPTPQVAPELGVGEVRPAPAVSVLIVNYNSGQHLAAAVRGLAAQSFGDFEAIVVDNGSADDSLAAAQSVAAGDDRVLFRRAKGNLGFAASNNRAAALARGVWLALLNPDAVPARDWLEQLIAATRRHPHAALFGSTQLDASDPQRLNRAKNQYLAIRL